MRRLVSAALAAALLAAPALAAAQGYPGGGQDRGGRRNPDEGARDKQREKERQRKEWEGNRLRLDRNRNAGPCPFVKVLYDAARFVEFTGQSEAATAVAWTGEIQGVEAECRYRNNDPITVDVDVVFNFGKGPRAEGDSRTFRYWVAVTERNRVILAKEYFDIAPQFDAGQDRVAYRDRIGGITIPRATETISGAAFEILIGFDVTPQMVEFNRAGKRFRIDVAPQAAAE